MKRRAASTKRATAIVTTLTVISPLAGLLGVHVNEAKPGTKVSPATAVYSQITRHPNVRRTKLTVRRAAGGEEKKTFAQEIAEDKRHSRPEEEHLKFDRGIRTVSVQAKQSESDKVFFIGPNVPLASCSNASCHTTRDIVERTIARLTEAEEAVKRAYGGTQFSVGNSRIVFYAAPLVPEEKIVAQKPGEENKPKTASAGITVSARALTIYALPHYVHAELGRILEEHEVGHLTNDLPPEFNHEKDAHLIIWKNGPSFIGKIVDSRYDTTAINNRFSQGLLNRALFLKGTPVPLQAKLLPIAGYGYLLSAEDVRRAAEVSKRALAEYKKNTFYYDLLSYALGIHSFVTEDALIAKELADTKKNGQFNSALRDGDTLDLGIRIINDVLKEEKKWKFEEFVDKTDEGNDLLLRFGQEWRNKNPLTHSNIIIATYYACLYKMLYRDGKLKPRPLARDVFRSSFGAVVENKARLLQEAIQECERSIKETREGNLAIRNDLVKGLEERLNRYSEEERKLEEVRKSQRILKE